MTYPTTPDLIRLAVDLAKRFPGLPLKYPSEGHLQAACFKLWNVHFRGVSVCYSVPNGGTRHPAEIAGMKAQGLRPGVSDLHLILEGGVIIFIEMKNGPRDLDPEQKLFKTKVENLGFRYYKIETYYQFAALLILLFDAEAGTLFA